MKHISLLLTFIFLITGSGYATGTEKDSPPVPEKVWYIDEPVFGGRICLYRSGNPEKGSLILVHGIGEKGRHIWDPILPDLEKDYFVIAPDLPGFGKSNKMNRLYSPENYARVIKWLADKFGRGPVTVAGHSMGASASLYFAGRYPRSLERLIMVDTAGILHRSLFPKKTFSFSTDSSSGFMKTPLSRVNSFIYSVIQKIDKGIMPDNMEEKLKSSLFREAALRKNPSIIAGLALIHTSFGVSIKNVRVPTYMIWGEEDTVSPLRTAMILSSGIKNSRLTVMPGVGHNPMTEEPERFNRLFLRSLHDSGGSMNGGLPRFSPSGKNITIKDRKDISVHGRFNRVDIIDSERIVLRDVHARRLRISGSTVAMERCRIESEHIAVKIENSTLRGTGSLIRGETGIYTNRSDFDLAGVAIRGHRAAVVSEYQSRFTFSVCDVKSPETRRPLHEVRVLEKGDTL